MWAWSFWERGAEFESALLAIMEDYLGRIEAIIGYTEEMSHVIQAGTDIFLMPSRYEPCGLTQMYSLSYGTPPVATAVGGCGTQSSPIRNLGPTASCFRTLLLNPCSTAHGRPYRSGRTGRHGKELWSMPWRLIFHGKSRGINTLMYTGPCTKIF